MNQNRLGRVIENMENAGLERILVGAPASIRYLTGLSIQPGERMLALLVESSGQARLFANRLFAVPADCGVPLSEYDDTDDPVKLLAGFVPDGQLGIDKVWPSQFTIRLMDERSGVRPVLGSRPVDLARMRKDEAEIAAMRRSSLMNDRVLGRIIPTLRAGETERQVADRYARFAVEAGAQGNSFEPLVCFGANCAQPHHETGGAALTDGDAVILDVGLLLGDYASDMTRTVFFGRATDEQRRVYQVVRAANEAGRAAARPGVRMSEIDRAARSVIEQAGYGDFFLHRTGHGIGLEVHEPPDVSAASDQVALPGMVFSVEPGVYLAGRFGVRVEDLVAITEDGAITLNELPRDLIEVQ